MIGDLSEATGRRLVQELKRRNDLDELAIPAFYPIEQCIDLLGKPAAWIRAQAAKVLGYRPGRGRAFELTPEQLLGIKRATAAGAR